MPLLAASIAPDILDNTTVKQVFLKNENYIPADPEAAISPDDNLTKAIEMMAKHNLEILPVADSLNGKITGSISFRDILSAYRLQLDEHDEKISISLKRRTLKMIVRSKNRVSVLKKD